MDKLKYVKLENQDGSYSSAIPLAVDSDHVDINGTTLTEKINAMETTKNSFSTTQNSAILGNEIASSTGWTLDGWTGNFATGFVHTIGQTGNLTFAMPVATGTKKYQVEFDVISPSPAGEPNASTAFTLTLGNSLPVITYRGAGSMHYVFGIQSLENGNLIFIPTMPADPWTSGGTFDGTIKNISIKEITTPYEEAVNIKDANNNKAIEIRSTAANKENLYIGKDTGKYNTSGDYNVAIGSNCFVNNTTGYFNTAVGYSALLENTTGSRNCAIGFQSLQYNRSGDRNYGLGSFTLHRNTAGRCNIAIGADTLWMNSTGSYNIAIGSASQAENTTTSGNTSIGHDSMGNAKGCNETTSIGYLSMASNGVTGDNIVAIGARSLYKNQGNNNTGIGYAALSNHTTGNNNTAVGYGALQLNVSGMENLSVGSLSGFSNTGNYNVFLGYGAGQNNTNNNNVFIGYNAGKSSGGAYNSICIGKNAEVITPNIGYQMNIGNVIYGDLSKGLIAIGKNKDAAAYGAILNIEVSPDRVIPPLRFTQQDLVETPVAGAFEYKGTHLYFTTGDGTRKEIQLNTIS